MMLDFVKQHFDGDGQQEQATSNSPDAALSSRGAFFALQGPVYVNGFTHPKLDPSQTKKQSALDDAA